MDFNYIGKGNKTEVVRKIVDEYTGNPDQIKEEVQDGTTEFIYKESKVIASLKPDGIVYFNVELAIAMNILEDTDNFQETEASRKAYEQAEEKIRQQQRESLGLA
jgi:hypothetical protein